MLGSRRLANAILDATLEKLMDGGHVLRTCLCIVNLIHLVSKHQKLKTLRIVLFIEKYLKPFFEDFELLDESNDLVDSFYQ
jgi:hypothetical protein